MAHARTKKRVWTELYNLTSLSPPTAMVSLRRAKSLNHCHTVQGLPLHSKHPVKPSKNTVPHAQWSECHSSTCKTHVSSAALSDLIPASHPFRNDHPISGRPYRTLVQAAILTITCRARVIRHWPRSRVMPCTCTAARMSRLCEQSCLSCELRARAQDDTPPQITSIIGQGISMAQLQNCAKC